MKKTKLILKMKLLVLLSATLCCLFAAPFGSCTWDAYAQDSCGTMPPPDPNEPPCTFYSTNVLRALCYVCQYYDGDDAACLAIAEKIPLMNLHPTCANCGDGFCSVGETCPQDCFTACGDGVCRYPEALVCGSDDPPECRECPSDCSPACGNGMCEGPETGDSCPQDCASFNILCGNGICESNENFITCPVDCAVCGDYSCNPTYEDADSCPEDCG
jgi:hypothetical protein